MEYALHILILIGIYFLLSASLNLMVGYTGLLSLAHAAFFGIGAYVAGLLALYVHTPALANIVGAMIISGVLGGVVGIPSLRLRDDYFAVGTFAFQVLVFNIFNNLSSFTGGPMGLSGIPQLSAFNYTVTSRVDYMIVVALAALCVFCVTHRIVVSPFGRVLKGIREDEMFAQSAGKDVVSYKVVVCVIGGAIAGVAGALYAYYVSYIDPTSFTVAESIFIVCIVIIGGAGSVWGPVVGSILLVVLPEALRFIGLPSQVQANGRQIIYGGLLVAFIIWRPSGLVGKYRFEGKMTRE